MNRHQFLAEFVYGVERHFDAGGVQASWAQGCKPAHRSSGSEDYTIEVPYTSDDHMGTHMAVSLDENYALHLAVALAMVAEARQSAVHSIVCGINRQA